MEKQLLNPWAKDCNGRFVSIEHAQPGQEYFCPKCNERLTYRKKGLGPRAHRDHFSHRPDCDCKGYTAHESESAIHKFAKESIFTILDNAIKEHQEFPISWTCRNCNQMFQGNLLQRANSVVVEKEFGSSRPDIALLDTEGRPIVAIEVVFTHDVEENTLHFYQDSSIVLVRVEVHSAEDCNDMIQKLSNPDSVSLCFNGECSTCQSMTHFRNLIHATANGEIIGIAVSVFNPFEDKNVKGVPLTQEEQRRAEDAARKIWPNRQFSMKRLFGINYLAPEKQQVTVTAPRPRRYIRYGGSPIDYIESNIGYNQSKKRYGSNRGKSNSSTKKRTSGVKKSGGKRRR